MIENNVETTKLAKNTVILYLRMLVTTIIGLLTSRIVLKELGIEDYGVYNVVGGVVVVFSFMQGALGNATSRFVAVALGKGDFRRLRLTFSTCVYLHFALSFVVLVFAETIGLWFFSNYLVVPQESRQAAMWVYQISILTTIISILSIPDNSLIIARERMSVFAYISIYDAVIKLIIAYSLSLFARDRLIVYAIFIFCSQVSVRLLYHIYCRKNFPETKLIYQFDKRLIKEISTFTGFVMLPSLGSICSTEGINILLNLFAGPAANAARGVSVQVQSLLTRFTQSFQQASNPQITKLCAMGEMERMRILISRTSKFSFYLMMLPFIPLFFEVDKVLNIWLYEVPEYSVEFCKLTLLSSLLATLDYPFIIGAAAEGRIKRIYTLGGVFSAMGVPVSYCFLKYGAPISSVYFVMISMQLCSMVIEFYYGGRNIGYTIKRLFKDVLFSITIVLLICLSISYFITDLITVNNVSQTILRIVCMIIMSLFVIAIVGVNKEERQYVRKKICNKFMI